MGHTQDLATTIAALPIFQAEWVLYLLLAMSLLSVGVMFERWIFFRRRRIDLGDLQARLEKALAGDDMGAAADVLAGHDSLATNVALFGLRAFPKGPEAVEDRMNGATRKEKERYDRRLAILATIASNAPFVGLFGTVLGVIHAFQNLSTAGGNASEAVMAGIAEALIATAVGLLVAIPAVVAFNFFKTKVGSATNDANFLSRLLLSELKARSDL